MFPTMNSISIPAICIVCSGFITGACPPDQEAAEVQAIVSQDSVPILGDLPLIGNDFRSQDATYQDALGHYYTTLMRGAGDRNEFYTVAVEPAVQESAVAWLTLALDQESKPLRVWLNAVEVEPQHLLLKADGNVVIQTTEGDEACSITADAVQLLTLVGDRVETEPQGRIGITMEAVPDALASQLRLDAASCVMILEVAEGGPAQRAGLQSFDVITHVDGDEGLSQDTLREAIQQHGPGGTIRLHIVRGGKLHEVDVEIEAAEENHPLVLVNEPASTYWQAVQQWTPDAPATALRDTRALWLLNTQRENPALLNSTVTFDPALGGWYALRRDQSNLQLLVEPTLRQAQVDLSITPQVLQDSSANNGFTLELKPRVIDGQVVIDTWAMQPSHVRGILRTTTEGEPESPIERLRSQIAELKAQIQSLEATVAELGEQQ